MIPTIMLLDLFIKFQSLVISVLNGGWILEGSKLLQNFFEKLLEYYFDTKNCSTIVVIMHLVEIK